jgi:hypothetical protein
MGGNWLQVSKLWDLLEIQEELIYLYNCDCEFVDLSRTDLVPLADLHNNALCLKLPSVISTLGFEWIQEGGEWLYKLCQDSNDILSISSSGSEWSEDRQEPTSLGDVIIIESDLECEE